MRGRAAPSPKADPAPDAGSGALRAKGNDIAAFAGSRVTACPYAASPCRHGRLRIRSGDHPGHPRRGAANMSPALARPAARASLACGSACTAPPWFGRRPYRGTVL